MNNKKRDVKFIIYQALYIFVICIIAIKGANLDLTEVDEKKMIEPGWTYVDTSNKVLIDRDELAKLIRFDSTKYVIVSIEDYKNNPEKYENNPPVQSAGFTGIQIVDNNESKEPERKIDESEKIEPKGDLNIGEITLVQYHKNPVNNKSDVPISVKGVTIPPHSTKTIEIGAEGSVTINAGIINHTISTIENKKPSVDIRQIASMSGDEIKLSRLQQTVGFRVTITDDYADQLDVKISGSVTSKIVKQTNNEIVIDVTLSAFGSKAAFDSYSNNLSQNSYKTTFTVSIKDKLAPHSIQRIGQFSFNEW